MNPFCLSTLRVLFTLSYIFTLHWSLVSCKLQHDPGGSTDFDLHDTKAVIGKYFNYSIPPPSRNAKHVLHYEVLEVGTSTIPSWLVFNHSSHSFHGVPLITDKGFYLMKVSLISLSENASSLQAHDVFAIDVDFETSQELTKKDILEGVGARPHQVLNTAKQLIEEISCRRNEIKTLMSVVFDVDVNHLNGSSRVSLISKLASFVNQPLEEFRISSKHSSVIDKLQADTVVAAGPGNIHSAGSREGVVVSWPLPCASQTLINQFPKVMARNIASGHFRDTTGFDVISWHISKVKDSDVKARGRSRRQAVMTVVPTPKPSQTASVVTTSSLIPVSSTVQSVQTLLTSSVESTLLFSPSSSYQSVSPFLSRTSGFILSTTPMYSSSTQVSLYSPSQSVQTLSSVVTESIQPSLSQSLFMTSFPTFLLSPTAIFSSMMPVSQLSPTSHQMTTSLSAHQTPISTAMDISESTSGVLISSPQLSTNVISPSTSVFPNFESTSSLVGSPSLFLSTEIISTSVFVTESPSVSSVESIQLSDSVTTVMLSSQSSTSVLPATSSISHLSSVFSSNFPSTVQSSEPETSFILQTSSFTRSGSLLPSTLVSRTSSLSHSSTLIGTSFLETISSIRYTSTEISTALQTTVTPPSTFLSTHLLFSSQILTFSLSSSEMILSSTESLQASSRLISTSLAEISSRSSVTPMISTETSLSLQIHSSSLSTYQTEVLSSVMMTDLSSEDVSVTQDVSVASTALPTTPVQSEIQTSDIVQSMTFLSTATIVPSIIVSSSDSASPGTPFTASSTSTSVSDTISQLVPSTLVMTPSLSGMVSSSFVVPDVTSVSAVIEVSTLSSTEDTTVSPLHTDDLSSTAMFIESTYLSEFLSSTVALDMSSLSPSLPPETPSLTFLETTVSSSLAFLTTTFPVSTSVMTSQIQSSYISSGSAARTGMSVVPTTSFQTPVISTVSASATTLMTEISSFVSHVSSGAPSFSESSLILSLPSTSDFLVQSSSLAPLSMSANTYVSSAPSVSLPRSEQSMGTSQDTTTFSTSLLFTLDSSSATNFPVFSTIVTSTSLFVPFASSTPPGVSSMSDSLAPSEFTTTPIQKSTSLELESDGSSTTFFFSEGQSETLTPSFFATSTSQQFASSPVATQRSSFSQSDMVSSTVIQPSISSASLFMSSMGVPSTQYSSTAHTVSSLTSSETSDLSSSFSESPTTVVPSITSSLPETESLVSTVSPALSTPSQLMSTSAPSSFLSSTQGVFISSSPSPTSSSSPVPSTLVVMSSSSTIPQPSSTAGQTSFLSSLPNSDASLPMSTLLVSSSHIQPTPSSSSPVDVSTTPPLTTEVTTPLPETTTEPGNQAPIIQHPIDEIIVALGDVLQFSIPEDTFLDAEDGLTFDLQLDLLTPDNQPVSPSHWLQLVNNQQTLAGVPLDMNLTVMRNEYLLSATDSEGLVAYDAFVVKVQERALDYNHEFVITLENDFQSFFDDSQNMVSFCDNVASFLNDQDTDAFSVASVTEGSVVVTYSNKTIPTKYCDYEAIDDIFSSLAFSNGTPTNAFQDALLPNYAVTDVERIFLHLCSATTVPPVTNVTESPATGTNLLLVTVLPASLIAFLLLICFLILCCCYKRKRGGEEFLLREEKPIYAKNRKPIYLDGELDDKEPRAASHPVILPIDVDPVKASRPFKRKSHESSVKPRSPPPQYRLPDYAQVNLGMDDFEDDFENSLFEMEPPTYTSQPVLHNAADSKPLDDRPPPLYRLPPPYQSQDRGFFEESDI